MRAGAVLATNLFRAVSGEKPLPYHPQKRSLYLLATGPKHAIMSWGRRLCTCPLGMALERLNRPSLHEAVLFRQQ